MLEQSEVIKLVVNAQNGDDSAKTRLITENSPLIKSVIRRYTNRGVEYDDLYQLGCMGFLKAIKNFSQDFNVKFSTYAVPMILGEVKRFLRDDGAIKISRSTKTLAGQISFFVHEYKAKNQSSPDIEAIAKEFKLQPHDIVFAMDSAKFPLSLYEKVDDDSDQTLLDKIASKENLTEQIDHIILKDLIGSLQEREKKIILLRYYRDKTQSEVAKALNVSQVQVSRLETKILSKIKSSFNGE